MSRIKQSVTVSLSPYVIGKLAQNVGPGQTFSTNSDAVNTALVEMFQKLEILEVAEAFKKVENSRIKDDIN